jgi:hypothetical protein
MSRSRYVPRVNLKHPPRWFRRQASTVPLRREGKRIEREALRLVDLDAISQPTPPHGKRPYHY